MEWLAEYGLFLAKLATVAATVGLVVGFAIRITRRGHRTFDRLIKVIHLNRRHRQMIATFERTALPRKTFRARRKAERVLDKARARAETRRIGHGGDAAGEHRRQVFVIDFKGDLRASEVDALRDEVTTILAVANEGDEVVVRLENGGGVPHGHGFGASQLARIRAQGIDLTVSVDRIALSGGYMMACVANRILAAPFAMVGSIGVFASIPNFSRLLKARGVDVEQLKAGEFKLTLTMLGENADEGRAKVQEQLDTMHRLFKSFVAEYRPALDIERVSTGEAWYARDALALHLVDEIRTSDDYLLEASRNAELFQIRGTRRPNLRRQLMRLGQAAVDRLSMHLTP